MTKDKTKLSGEKVYTDRFCTFLISAWLQVHMNSSYLLNLLFHNQTIPTKPISLHRDVCILLLLLPQPFADVSTDTGQHINRLDIILLSVILLFCLVLCPFLHLASGTNPLVLIISSEITTMTLTHVPQVNTCDILSAFYITR